MSKEFDLENLTNGWISNEDLKEIEMTAIQDCINKCTSPAKEDIFKAFTLFSLKNTKVLILGQDPYTEKSGKADGYAFSVANDKKDASLINIFKAIKAYQKNCKFDKILNKDKEILSWSTNLQSWAKNNGVLLLNTALTHSGTNKKAIEYHRKAWEPFISNIIRKLMCSDNTHKLVVFLWGKNAQCAFFNAIKEMPKFEPINCYLMRKMILMTSHPSNMGGSVKKGFSEDAPCHFKVCDEFLELPIWKNYPANN